MSEAVWLCSMGRRYSVVKLLGGRVCNRGGVVKTVVGTGCWLLLSCGCVSWAVYGGFKLGRQAAWRPRCNRCGVVKWLVALCSLLVICDCVLLGLCMRGSSSVVKLLGGRGAIMVVLSRRLMALCILLLCCDCVLLGLCVWGSSSVVELIGGRVQSG